MKTLTLTTFLLASLLLAPSQALSQGLGSTAGLSLIEAPTARAAGLSEALVATQDDVAAFSYNPASLNTLQKGHASFLYQKHFDDEAYGQFLIGAPFQKASLGLSVGYYDAGEFHLFDGESRRRVKAQQDFVMAAGLATGVGRLSIGLTGKYISSEIGEVAKAQTVVGDIGVQMPLHRRMTVGAAVQNLGKGLRFSEEEEDLPQIARAGFSLNMFSGLYATQLFFDAPYYLNQQELIPALGLEKLFGPLSVRAGFKLSRDSQEFSIGTGLVFGQTTLDYAFGLMDNIDSQHRISLATRFGQGRKATTPTTLTLPEPEEKLYPIQGNRFETTPTPLQEK